MTTQRENSDQALADAIARRLASPSEVGDLVLPHDWWPQSLAYGAAGIALLHIERARTGLAPWERAHDWLACAAAGEVFSGVGSHLYYGAPAVAFALHAAADRPGRYARALDRLDHHIARTTRRRLEAAHDRMDRGELPALAEFDAIRGLTGVGAYLLGREEHAGLIRAVLAYLVRLTEPVSRDGEQLPGWWTSLAPSGQPSPRFPRGHANNGTAHGVSGVLALLSRSMRNGVAVDGQAGAIKRICAWLDQWRQDTETGPRWPYWVTSADLRAGRPSMQSPARPSWCYGTAGQARAQQLAALATGDIARQRMAEHALLCALTDRRQLAATTDLSLCHGYAGLLHVTGRAAADANAPALDACLPHVLGEIIPGGTDPADLAGSLLGRPAGDPGLLEGAAGIALALHAAQTGKSPASGWDACLLIN